MPVRSLVFDLAAKGWEKVRDLGKEIQGSVKRSEDMSKETLREIVQATREASVLGRAASKEAPRFSALQQRADALRAGGSGPVADLRATSKLGSLFGRASGIGSTLAGAANASTAAGAAGQALSLASTAALAIPGLGAAITLTVQQVVIPLFQERERQQQLARQDDAAATAAFISQEFQTFAERLKSDPEFAYVLARRANNEILEEEAALNQRGLSPASRGLFEGDQ